MRATARISGEERDSETGLDFFQARYYGAALGRFTSPDAPLIGADPKDPQSWNLYNYVRNRPLNATDPTGHYVVDCVWDGCPGLHNGGGSGGPVGYGGASNGGLGGEVQVAEADFIHSQNGLGTNYKEQEARHLAITTYGWDPTWSLKQKYNWASDVISSNNTAVNGHNVSNNLAVCTSWSESSFDPRSSNLGGGGAGAWGLFGTRTPAIADFNRIFKTNYTLQDVHSSANISAYVGTAYLSLVLFTYHHGDINAGLTAAGDGTNTYAPKIQDCARNLNDGKGVDSFK